MAAGEPKQAYLKGIIVPGIFENERGFIITVDDRSIALYASRLDVIEEGEDGLRKPRTEEERPGKLRVFVVGTQEGLIHVLLRQEAGTGEKTLFVKREQVEFVT